MCTAACAAFDLSTRLSDGSNKLSRHAHASIVLPPTVCVSTATNLVHVLRTIVSNLPNKRIVVVVPCTGMCVQRCVAYQNGTLGQSKSLACAHARTFTTDRSSSATAHYHRSEETRKTKIKF